MFKNVDILKFFMAKLPFECHFKEYFFNQARHLEFQRTTLAHLSKILGRDILTDLLAIRYALTSIFYDNFYC